MSLDPKEYAWVAVGSQRRSVIRVIDGIKIVTDLSKASDISLNNVSRVLIDFKKCKLVKCINPEDKLGRIYKLTAKGARIQKEIIKNS